MDENFVEFTRHAVSLVEFLGAKDKEDLTKQERILRDTAARMLDRIYKYQELSFRLYEAQKLDEWNDRDKTKPEPEPETTESGGTDE